MGNASTGGGKIEDGSKPLVLEIDTGNTPERGVGFQLKFEDAADMGGIKEGVHSITLVPIEGHRWGCQQRG